MQVIEGVTSVSPEQELLYKHALEETLLNQGIIVTDDQIVIIYVFTSGIVTITGEQSFMCVEYSY
jgi:hypothetical protein